MSRPAPMAGASALAGWSDQAAPSTAVPTDSGGISGLAAVDADGNAAACSLSMGQLFGARIIVPGTGILLGAMTADSAAVSPRGDRQSEQRRVPLRRRGRRRTGGGLCDRCGRAPGDRARQRSAPSWPRAAGRAATSTPSPARTASAPMAAVQHGHRSGRIGPGPHRPPRLEIEAKVSRRSEAVDPFIVMDVMAAAAAKEAAGDTVIHLEVGQPSTPAPKGALAAAHAALDADRIGYVAALGMPALRERIARHYREVYNAEVSPEQVIVTTGSCERIPARVPGGLRCRRSRRYIRPPVREIAGLRLDPFRREVFRDGRYIALTRKQFAVLEVLVAAEGGVVSAEELLERAWDENADPFTNAVASPSRRCANASANPRSSRPSPASGIASTQRGAGGTDRGPWIEPRNERSPQAHLSYAGFLMIAGILLLAAVWVFLLRYVPDRASDRPRLHRLRAARRLSRAVEPLARVRPEGSGRVGVPARVRSGGRVDPRRPHTRAGVPYRRCHRAPRRPGRSRTESTCPAAMTSSASSRTRSTRCSRGLKPTSPNSGGSQRTPPTNCALRWPSRRRCSTWRANDPNRDTGELLDRL